MQKPSFFPEAKHNEIRIWARFFTRLEQAKKPGFPLQVLGSAHALPVGFPLQSLARAAAAYTVTAKKKKFTAKSKTGTGEEAKEEEKSTRYVFKFHGIAVYFRMCHQKTCLAPKNPTLSAWNQAAFAKGNFARITRSA
jgi:hypothetical protein